MKLCRSCTADWKLIFSLPHLTSSQLNHILSALVSLIARQSLPSVTLALHFPSITVYSSFMSFHSDAAVTLAGLCAEPSTPLFVLFVVLANAGPAVEELRKSIISSQCFNLLFIHTV